MAHSNLFRIACLIGGALALGGAAAPAPQRPARRIVSLNLCADQYLLALADRGQIAGLTANAADPQLSAAAARTHGLHILSQSAEEVLAINPDLVVGVPARRSTTMAALSDQHYHTLDLKTAHSYAEIVAQIRTVAAAIGHPERGEALVARMDRALAGLRRAPHAGVAAYYQRRGYLTGTGTLVDDLMTRVGLTNLASRLHKKTVAQLSLEELVAAQPDYLIVESESERVTDQGTELLHHPLLAHIPRLRVPQAWTVCGGPAFVLAAQSLAAQLARAPRVQISAR